MHVPFLMSRIMMFSLLLETVLSVRTCWFYNIVTLHSLLYYYYYIETVPFTLFETMHLKKVQ